MAGSVGPGRMGKGAPVNNVELSRALGVAQGIHQITFAPDDGRGSVVAAYCIGQASLLVADQTAFRDPGSDRFYVWCRPRVPGDGPTYGVAWSAMRPYLGGADLDATVNRSALPSEERQAELQTAQLDRDTGSAVRQAPKNDVATVAGDLKEAAADSPATLGRWTGAAAGAIVRGTTSILGAGAAEFLAALPVPVLVVGGAAIVGGVAFAGYLLVQAARRVK